MKESLILSACLKKENYEQVLSALAGESFAATFSPIAKAVAELLEEFYTIDPSASSCSREALVERARQKAHNPHHVKAIEDFCGDLDGTISIPNVVHDFRNHRRFRIGDKIAGLLANRAETGELDELISAYQSLKAQSDDTSSDNSTSVVCDLPVSELFSEHLDIARIPFGIQSLDKATRGGMRPGHHALIYARPEIGKSLLALDFCSHWIGLGHRVLYVENEEPLTDTLLRLIGRLCRRPYEDVRDHPSKAQQIIEQRGYSNFIGVSLSPGTFGEIERLVDRYEPHIVVLNQLRNLNVGDDNRVTALDKAGTSARNLAKSRRVCVLSITQAGESAEGKSVLGLSDIDFSKTGIPGTLDLAIGIGASEEDKRFNIRTISLPKNKLGGEHSSFQIRISPQTGVVEEVSQG